MMLFIFYDFGATNHNDTIKFNLVALHLKATRRWRGLRGSVPRFVMKWRVLLGTCREWGGMHTLMGATPLIGVAAARLDLVSILR